MRSGTGADRVAVPGGRALEFVPGRAVGPEVPVREGTGPMLSSPR